MLAQDVIYTLAGQRFLGKVVEINDSTVLFREIQDSTQKTHIILINEVEQIIYEKGAMLFIQPPDNHTDVKVGGKQYSPPTEKIVLINGEDLFGNIIERKRFGIFFLNNNAPNAPPIYIPLSQIARIEIEGKPVEYIKQRPPIEFRKELARNFQYLTPHYLAFNLGIALPMGSFGDKISTNSGFATPGYSTQADLTLYLLRGTGISMLGGFNAFGSHNTKQRENITSFIQNTHNTQTVNLTEGNWEFRYLMAGMGYFSEHGRLFLDVRFLVGYMQISAPTYRTSYEITNELKYTTFVRPDVGVMAVGGSFQLRYFINRAFQLKAAMQMIVTQENFKPFIATDHNGVEFIPNLTNNSIVKMDLGWLSFDAGIAFTLGK
jgi:hypothetical protein